MSKLNIVASLIERASGDVYTPAQDYASKGFKHASFPRKNPPSGYKPDADDKLIEKMRPLKYEQDDLKKAIKKAKETYKYGQNPAKPLEKRLAQIDNTLFRLKDKVSNMGSFERPHNMDMY